MSKKWLTLALSFVIATASPLAVITEIDAATAYAASSLVHATITYDTQDRQNGVKPGRWVFLAGTISGTPTNNVYIVVINDGASYIKIASTYLMVATTSTAEETKVTNDPTKQAGHLGNGAPVWVYGQVISNPTPTVTYVRAQLPSGPRTLSVARDSVWVNDRLHGHDI